MIPDEMLKKARKNLLLRSRTANGIVDTSINRDKAGILMIQSGDDAAKTASENFDDAIRYAWEERDAVLESPTDLRRLIESIAAKINKGTLKDGYLIRTLDTDRRSYVRCFALAGYMEDFYNTLFCKLAACPGNPVEEAAYTEYGIDIEGHFSVTAVGKALWRRLRGYYSEEGMICRNIAAEEARSTRLWPDLMNSMTFIRRFLRMNERLVTVR